MGRQVPSCRAPFPAFPVWILFTPTCPLPHVNLRISVLVEKRGADQLSSGNTTTVVLKPLKPQAPKPSVCHLPALSFSSVLPRLDIKTLMALLDYE